jgi:hypothetical protein
MHILDVKILTHGMIKMRELYKKVSGLDITRYVTIAVIKNPFFQISINNLRVLS